MAIQDKSSSSHGKGGRKGKSHSGHPQLRSKSGPKREAWDAELTGQSLQTSHNQTAKFEETRSWTSPPSRVQSSRQLQQFQPHSKHSQNRSDNRQHRQRTDRQMHFVVDTPTHPEPLLATLPAARLPFHWQKRVGVVSVVGDTKIFPPKRTLRFELRFGGAEFENRSQGGLGVGLLCKALFAPNCPLQKAHMLSKQSLGQHDKVPCWADFRGTQLDDGGLSQLLRCLSDERLAVCTERLWLTSNCLGPRSEVPLRKFVAVCGSGLRELHLTSNALDDEAAFSILSALAAARRTRQGEAGQAGHATQPCLVFFAGNAVQDPPAVLERLWRAGVRVALDRAVQEQDTASKDTEIHLCLPGFCEQNLSQPGSKSGDLVNGVASSRQERLFEALVSLTESIGDLSALANEGAEQDASAAMPESPMREVQSSQEEAEEEQPLYATVDPYSAAVEEGGGEDAAARMQIAARIASLQQQELEGRGGGVLQSALARLKHLIFAPGTASTELAATTPTDDNAGRIEATHLMQSSAISMSSLADEPQPGSPVSVTPSPVRNSSPCTPPGDFKEHADGENSPTAPMATTQPRADILAPPQPPPPPLPLLPPSHTPPPRTPPPLQTLNAQPPFQQLLLQQPPGDLQAPASSVALTNLSGAANFFQTAQLASNVPPISPLQHSHQTYQQPSQQVQHEQHAILAPLDQTMQHTMQYAPQSQQYQQQQHHHHQPSHLLQQQPAQQQENLLQNQHHLQPHVPTSDTSPGSSVMDSAASIMPLSYQTTPSQFLTSTHSNWSSSLSHHQPDNVAVMSSPQVASQPQVVLQASAPLSTTTSAPVLNVLPDASATSLNGDSGQIAAGRKRKIDLAAYAEALLGGGAAVAPAAGQQQPDSVDAELSEEPAPWKSQRRRLRRPAGTSATGSA
eukprot:TRINITY_DN2988_c1_g1_i1.p1 TRINITY_DN2988_c1_g1~~TRINITY_DN2988_c1_g1_i1.p1  ORF type:complete len:910 (-),score=170.71 TRINITY_DN2988_c1_g1_i1:207-2936(-)